MKLLINKKELLENLEYVSKAVSFKNLIPILNGIKFEIKKDGLYLTGSDNNITIISFIKKELISNIEGEEEFILQGKYIVDIIRKLPDGEILFQTTNDSKIIISAKNSEFYLNCLNKEDYPNISIETIKNPVVILEREIKEMINKTAFATSNQESRPILTGINFKINKNNLEFTATDSYRLAKKIMILEESNNEEINIIIPSKNLNELVKILNNDDKKIEIHVFSNKVLFKFDNLLFESKLLNGNYPDTSKLIPLEANNNIIMNRHEFYSIIDRASLLTSEKEKNVVKLEASNNEVIIKSNSPEIGKVEEKITGDIKNDETIKISFSARYMMEALKTFDDEKIILEFNGEVKPLILKDSKNIDMIQLILPIRTY